MGKAEIVVGRDLRQAVDEIAVVWKEVESATAVTATDRIYVVDGAAFCAVLTPKRFDLPRHLRGSPASGVRALARALGRDVGRVHVDVEALADIGLITRAVDGTLSSDVDEIASTSRIAA